MNAKKKTAESRARDEFRPPFCDVSIVLPAAFKLQSGERLSKPELALRIYGDLSKPVIVVAGGISAGRAAADDGLRRGWWRELVCDGGAVDLRRFCVITFDFLPNPDEIARTFSTRDQAAALEYALAIVNCEKLFAFVGASYGAMVGLAFAARYPKKCDRLIAISGADRANPTATALRGVQRRIIDFAQRAGNEREGVSLARQLAMITYRSATELSERFINTPPAHAGEEYPVCEYLTARGGVYEMSADRYISLSDSIDRHNVDATLVEARTLLIAADTDWLVPADDIRRLHAQIDGAVFSEISSRYGHDAFLKEYAALTPLISDFLKGIEK